MKYPWIAWYPAEYISKTRSLTMKQHGAYCLLLWEYYTNGPLLANASGLLNVCCSRTEEDREDVATILKTFFFLEDGFWHHKRADEEIKKRVGISKHRQLVGRKGGLAKATRLLEQKPTQSQSQSHIHIKEEPSLNLPLENSETVATAPKRNSRGERLPEDFIPWPEHYALAKELGLNVEMEFQKFRDYWLGASGEKARKCDWPATLRNWLRNSAERKESRNGRFEANGPELTKTQQRVINNRNAILAGFGVNPPTGRNEPSVQDRANAGGGENLEKRFLKGKS